MKQNFFLWLGTLLFVLVSSFAYGQNNPITGTVTDATGIPMPGVNVIVEGTQRGVSTDFDGRYTIDASPGEVLVFTYIGSTTVEKTLGEQRTINATLELDSNELDEVVVIGYGTAKKSDVTGALVSVSSEELLQQPVNNAFEALQGKAAGVDITSSQRPGTIGTVRIRGNRSLTASNSPLYVVDGVPLMSPNSIETLNP